MRLLPGLLVAATLAAAPASAHESVQIPHHGAALQAALFRPPGDGPFPAVVALHGCSGLGRRAQPVGVQYRDWAERLVAAGYAVVFPDSFGSRAAGPQCGVRERRIRPRVERVQDADAARRWLQAQPWVRKDRIFLLGWSNGGSTALWAVRPQAARPDGEFRSAIAFYPGCASPGRAGWNARLPILILIGAADDWTPAQDCQALADEARRHSVPVELVTYPGAHHGFDHPDLPLRRRQGMAYTPDRSGQAQVGTNPAARADAIRRVLEWLSR